MTKLTEARIDALIEDMCFFKHKTLTVCVLTLTNGAMVTGESNVIDPSNYDADEGEHYAWKDARQKIWQLEGYAMKRDLCNSQDVSEADGQD